MKVNKIRMMHLFVSVLFHVSLSWIYLRSIFFFPNATQGGEIGEH